MTREEKLFSAIGGVPDALVAEAADPGEPGGRGRSWGRWGALAAALVLVVGLARFFPRMGGASAGGDGIIGEAAPGEVAFMSYAGPALPLTVLDGPEGLPATREVAWDFRSTQDAQVYSVRSAVVTDTTAITNDRGEDLTVTVGYPVAASLRDDGEVFPALTVNGDRLEVELLWGDAPERAFRMESWEDYEVTLEDGSYLEAAREDAPELGQVVTVWELSDEAAPGLDDRNLAPTLAVSFQIDEEKTQVYTYGFNGAEISEDGFRRYSFFVRGDKEPKQKRYLIFLGEPPAEYAMGGYENGGCEKVLDGVTAKMTAFTTTLGDLLDRLAEDSADALSRLEDLRRALRRVMDQFLSEPPEERYGVMMEDLISHALVAGRVVWATAEVVIPRGETVTVVARYEKGPSYDYACANTQRKGLYGWDLAVRLGSNLDFKRVTARLEGVQRLEVVRNDFGFDQEAGVLEVEIPPEREHCAMEVRLVPAG